jgi:hypothetical protein
MAVQMYEISARRQTAGAIWLTFEPLMDIFDGFNAHQGSLFVKDYPDSIQNEHLGIRRTT